MKRELITGGILADEPFLDGLENANSGFVAVAIVRNGSGLRTFDAQTAAVTKWDGHW